MKTLSLTAAITALTAATAFGAAHESPAPAVMASDQSVEGGTVTADSITAPANGWLVVHRTDADMAPGIVVGHAPLKMGENMDVTAILTEEVASGDMLMLMVHGEDGGEATGIFEYTLGAQEDGPIRVDGDLVTAVITAE